MLLSHALESLTALPYDSRVAPESPGMRPAYQGANPISDIWATKAIEMVAANLVRAIQDTEDDEARSAMLLAAGLRRNRFRQRRRTSASRHELPGQRDGTQLQTARVPDGSPDHSARNGGYPQRAGSLSFHRSDESCEAPVCGAADGVWTFPTRATRMQASCWRGRFISLMQKTGVANGLGAIGFTEEDIPALVKGTLPQHRVTKLSPRPAEANDLEALFRDAMQYW